MDEPMDRFEQRLGSALREYVERPDAAWEPAEVVADVTARPRAVGRTWPAWSMPVRLVAAVVVILALGLTVVVGPRLVPGPGSGSAAAMAIVDGIEYRVGVARSLIVDMGDLTPYGLIESSNWRAQIRDPTAFSLEGIDPLAALVVRAAPGLSDDFGPLGEHLLLWGPKDPFPSICAYFESGHPASPTQCGTAVAGPTSVRATPAALTPPPASSSAPPLGGANGTPLDITVSVNGITVGPLPRQPGLLAIDTLLPGLPWSLEVHTLSGRVIAELSVPTDFQPGTYIRSDLSCGPVLLWVGSEPVYGPAPPSFGAEGPGAPGDCDP